MSEAVWLPEVLSLSVGVACLAIAVSLFVIGRRVARPELWRAHAAASVFLLGTAALSFFESGVVGYATAELGNVLRAITAFAALVTALLIFSDVPKAFAATTTTTTTTTTAAREPTSAPPAAPSELAPEPASTPDPTPPAPNGSLLSEAAPEASFLGLVSHELRTPLTAMQLLLDRLSDNIDELPPRHRKLIERMSSTATRLTDLVDSILYYARIRAGVTLATSIEPFDLRTLAMDVADELRPQASRKSLELEASSSSDRVPIESDPKLLRLVIVNLLSNAVKFTERGKVAIAVSSQGAERVVRVTDSGTGIDPAEQKRIFEPFHNVEPRKHKHLPGVGLGLSLARQIVDNLGGRIAVRSERGKGSTFEVSLPAVARPRSADVRAP
jgi:signal transduction histidine kinase